MKRTFKRLGRRLFALALAAVMVLGVMPEMTAQAAGTENQSEITKSAFENAYNLDQSDTCYGTVKLDGSHAITDSGTPNVWPTGNWGGAVDVTGYNWVQITNTNPDVATASYRTEGGRLYITFTPGTGKGTTRISVGVDARYPHYSLGTWNMELNFDYIVSNGGTELNNPTYMPNSTTNIVINLDDNTWSKNGINQGGFDDEKPVWGGYYFSKSSSDGWSSQVYYPVDISSVEVTNSNPSVATDIGTEVVVVSSKKDSLGRTQKGLRTMFEGLEAGTTTIKVVATYKIYSGEYRQDVTTKYTLTYNVTVIKSTKDITLTYKDSGLEAKQIGPAGEFAIHGPLTEKAGQTFLGWSEQQNASEPMYKFGEKHTFTQDTILYAVWKEKTPDIMDLTATKTPSQEYPVVGEEFAYTIKVENAGSAAATVKVTDKLPEGLDFLRVSENDGGIYDEESRTVTWDNVKVPANGSKELHVWVKATKAGEISNTAVVRMGDETISAETTITARDTTPEAPTAQEVNRLARGDVSAVEVYCNPDRHKVGYFDCYNEKDGNIIHTDRITIGEVTGENGNYTCTVTFLAEKYAEAYSVLKKTDHTLAEGEGDKEITLKWNVAAEKWELASDAEAPVVFHVECREPVVAAPALEVTKTVEPATVEAGKTVTYTITVENTGNAKAENVIVTDRLDEKLEWKSCDNGGNYTSDTRTATWTIAELAPGESKVLKLVATALEGGEIKNTAYAKLPDETGNGTPSNESTVEAQKYAISVKKSLADPAGAEFDAGAEVRYKVEVTNTGNATLYNTYITDTMDPGLTMGADGNNEGCEYKGCIGTVERNGLTCSVYKWILTEAFEPGQTITLYYTAVIGEEDGEGLHLLNRAYARGYKAASTQQRTRANVMALSDDPGYVEGSSGSDGGYVESGDDSSVIITVKSYAVKYQWNLPEGASEQLPVEPKHTKNATVTVDTKYANGMEITVGTGDDAKTYVFSGWTVEGVSVTDGKFVMPNREVVISGTWTEKQDSVQTITVTWKNGETGETIKELKDKYLKGTVAEDVSADDYPQAPEVPGKVFVKWNLETAADGNITITATYDVKEDPAPVVPDPGILTPGIEEIRGLIGVVVSDEGEADHGTERYSVDQSSITIGSVTDNGDGTFNCDITISPAWYVSSYNAVHGLHTHANAPKTVTLVYHVPEQTAEEDVLTEDVTAAEEEADSTDYSEDTQTTESEENGTESLESEGEGDAEEQETADGTERNADETEARKESDETEAEEDTEQNPATEETEVVPGETVDVTETEEPRASDEDPDSEQEEYRNLETGEGTDEEGNEDELVELAEESNGFGAWKLVNPDDGTVIFTVRCTASGGEENPDPIPPTEPGNPTEPTAPTEPATPTEPTVPTEPTTPTAPTTPTGPTNPGTPTQPEGTPATPVDPAPAAPVTPVTAATTTVTGPAAQTAIVTPVAPTPVEEEEPEEVELEDEAVPQAEPVQEPEEEAVDDGELEELEEDEVPLAAMGGSSGPSWALLNLILTILTAVVSLLLLTFYFAGKRREDQEEESLQMDEEEGELKRKGLVRLLSILPAVFAVITFILTEDMRNPMIFVDRWTLLMLLYAVVNVVLAFFAIKKREEEKERVTKY